VPVLFEESRGRTGLGKPKTNRQSVDQLGRPTMPGQEQAGASYGVLTATNRVVGNSLVRSLYRRKGNAKRRQGARH